MHNEHPYSRSGLEGGRGGGGGGGGDLLTGDTIECIVVVQ